MTFTERRIAASYSGLFEGLSISSKKKLIETLTKSLDTGKKARDVAFYKSFGAFASDKTAEEIIAEIKAGRKFREKNIEF